MSLVRCTFLLVSVSLQDTQGPHLVHVNSTLSLSPKLEQKYKGPCIYSVDTGEKGLSCLAQKQQKQSFKAPLNYIKSDLWTDYETGTLAVFTIL